MAGPVIALPFWDERWVGPYAAGARAAGATVRSFPIRGAPPPATVFATAAGLLLIGGGDVAAERFGATDAAGLSRHVEPERDAYELDLLAAALERDLPVLGICRGHQLLGVARAGALHIDLPSERPDALPHACPKEALDAHPVAVAPGSRLRAILGCGECLVNSRHHQALRADRVGDGLRVSAVAPDGIVEAVEAPDHDFVVGVQWHPEDFVGHGDRFAPLFAAFVRRAAARLGAGTSGSTA